MPLPQARHHHWSSVGFVQGSKSSQATPVKRYIGCDNNDQTVLNSLLRIHGELDKLMLIKAFVHELGLCWQTLTVRTHSDGQLKIVLDLCSLCCLLVPWLTRSLIRPSICAPIHPSVLLSQVLGICSWRQVTISAHGPWIQNLFLGP